LDRWVPHAGALAAIVLVARRNLAQLLAGDAVEARRFVEGVAVLEFQARLDVRVERVPEIKPSCQLRCKFFTAMVL
jgi:hypothetical protein